MSGGTPGPASPKMGATDWLLLLLLSALWGGSFFFFKILVDALPPCTVVLGRVGFAALILHAWLLLRRDPMPLSMPGAPRLLRQFLVMGLLNNVIPFSLIVFGETRISSGLASILNAMTPVFGVLVAHLLTANEKLTWGRGAGVLLGLSGVALLVGPGSLTGLLGDQPGASPDVIGEAACLTAAMSYAFAGIYGRRFRGIPSLKVATGQITASTIILLPLAAIFDQPWRLPMPGPPVWLAFAGIAFLSTALAYLLYFRILATAGATNLLLVTFLLPVSAVLLGWLALGEQLAPSAFLGMAIIGLGLGCIDGRLLRLRRRRAAAEA